MQSASLIASIPFKVIKPSSPGPAPTSLTFPAYLFRIVLHTSLIYLLMSLSDLFIYKSSYITLR